MRCRHREQAPSLDDVDFRVPIARDTFQLIGSFPLTGVGSGQFRWVFPQYRDLTVTAHTSVAPTQKVVGIGWQQNGGFPRLFASLCW